MKEVLFVVCLIYSSILLAKEKNNDYGKYHELINKAETQYFVNKNIDSCLYFYDKVFEDYDFVFVKDLLNASQIACFNNRPFEQYILRSFDYGLREKHFEDYPILKQKVSEMLNDQSVLKIVESKHKKYLTKIDFEYRSWLYNLAIDDQLSKSSKNYDVKINILLEKLISKIKTKGFPGEKIIGIDDDKIFSEIGKSSLDFSEQVNKRDSRKLSYFELDEDLLASKLPLLLLVHHKCSYDKLENLFMEQIKQGNIHPRDVGLVYDNVFRFVKQQKSNYCPSRLPKNCFLLSNIFTKYPEKLSKDHSSVNKIRDKFYIVSVEVDKIKKSYEKDFGFNLFSGFWNCR